MDIEWLDGSRIRVMVDKETVTISANREGLLSLARQLSEMADGDPGDHIHYDEYNSLEDGSSEMIIEKIDL